MATTSVGTMEDELHCRKPWNSETVRDYQENHTKEHEYQKSFIGTLERLDIELSRKLSFCAAKGSSSWRTVLICLEISGHGVPWIFATLLAVYVFRNQRQQFACNFLLALLLDLVVVGLTKVIFQRKRPVYNEMDMFATVAVDNFSFPSGHSTRAAMVAGLFTLVVSGDYYRWLIYLWASCVAVSRVVLGRHHVSDVVLGSLIGLVQYWVMVKIWLSVLTCQKMLSVIPLVELL